MGSPGTGHAVLESRHVVVLGTVSERSKEKAAVPEERGSFQQIGGRFRSEIECGSGSGNNLAFKLSLAGVNTYVTKPVDAALGVHVGTIAVGVECRRVQLALALTPAGDHARKVLTSHEDRSRGGRDGCPMSVAIWHGGSAKYSPRADRTRA
jgi:hypothetical protein